MTLEILTSQSIMTLFTSTIKKGVYIRKEEALTESLLVFIGGERGWHESEIEYFNQKKIKEVTISESTLRVEFAVCGFLSQLDFLKNAVI